MDDLVLPSPFAEIPRTPLMWLFPSPLEKLERISADLAAHGVNIWTKREDCNSGLAFGGNKIRKLEYVMYDALAGGYDVVVSCGRTQSNCVRQVAAAAAKLGLESVLVELPHSAMDFTPPTKEFHTLGNVQITRMISDGRTTNSVEMTMAALKASGREPYLIPKSTFGHPLGGLGFARFAFELIRQEYDNNILFNVIIITAMSGSSTGGILAGLKLAEKVNYLGLGSRPRRLIAVYPGSTPETLHSGVLETAKLAAVKIGLDPSDISDSDYRADFRFNAGAYGKVDQATAAAIKYAASKEGLLLDPVYTGKGFAGLLAMVKAGEIERGSNVLFIHTGGAPVLSAYG